MLPQGLGFFFSPRWKTRTIINHFNKCKVSPNINYNEDVTGLPLWGWEGNETLFEYDVEVFQQHYYS